MRRRSIAGGGKAAKTRRRKTVTLKRRNAPKTPRQSGSSAASPETEVARLTRELHEALEQRTATAEVLKIISASPTELQPVLEAVVRSAARFCEADDVTIFELNGQDLRIAAHWGVVPQDVGARFPCVRGHVVGRAVLERNPVHEIDLQAEAEEFPEGSAFARRLGHRTIAAVPLLREGMAAGAIVLRRAEVNPFTDKQITLLETFAAQAVIAIENTRLLNELRQSLEQQTATAEILGAISSSPGRLEPVFDAILENAVRLGQADMGHIYRWTKDGFHVAAMRGEPAAYEELVRKRMPWRPGAHAASVQAMERKEPVQVADMKETYGYSAREAATVAAVEIGGIRTILCVPMLRENEAIGVIIIYRREVRPFSQSHIDLVVNFAKQAVIAIENARLLNELRESLQQQTATAAMLKVLSRSTFDLQAVLKTLVESAGQLCGAYDSAIWRPDGSRLLLVAHHGPIRAETLPLIRGTV